MAHDYESLAKLSGTVAVKNADEIFDFFMILSALISAYVKHLESQHPDVGQFNSHFRENILEKIPAKLAKKVAKSVNIPIIGIGAGADVDGQVLVLHDMLGMTQEFNPRFLRRYLNLFDEINNAIGQYCKDVKNKEFPNSEEEY